VATRWIEADGSERWTGSARSELIAEFNNEASRLLDEIDPPHDTNAKEASA
jgi:hypothetical protein